MIPVTNKTLLTVLTVTCIVLAACGGGGAGGPAARELVVAIPADVETFNDYQSAGEAMENAIIDLLFPTLFEEQPDFAQHPPSFAPRLAESWEFSPNHLVLTVRLRQDAWWSDGFRVTADDVRFTFQAQTSEAAGSTYVEQKAAIARVEVVDASTVRFHFKRVYPYQLMDANDGHIVAAHAWAAIPFDKWPTTNFTPGLVSAGAFRLVSHTAQQTIVLERDPRHWRPARLDRIVFRVIPDSAGQIGQLLAGDVQLIPMVPPREVARLQASPDVRVVSLPSRLLGFLAWNNHRPALADRRVRRALGLAIDRQALVDTVYLGHAKVANGPVLSSMWAYDRELPALPHDPAEAARVLAEAGWNDDDGDGLVEKDGRGLEVELLYPTTNTMRAQMAVLIQADLARVGVKVLPRPVEFAALMARQEAGDFDGVLAAWEEATKVDLASGWATPGADQGTGNFFGYSNPEVDELLRQVAAAPDLDRTRVLLAHAQRLIVADQPVTFLYEGRQVVALSRRLENATPSAAGVFFGIGGWELGN